eukprot:Gb_20880 [translate_table: standard]
MGITLSRKRRLQESANIQTTASDEGQLCTKRRRCQGQNSQLQKTETDDACKSAIDNEDTVKVTCKDIFLSHSGFQKNFVEQLHKDLQRENMSSFFDKDKESLPKGREFPSLIFENARNCKVAVLVLSDEFLTSKWPMLELDTIVEAKNFTNPDVKILPLFYKISAGTLRQKLGNNDFLPKWKAFQEKDSRIDWNKWYAAVKEMLKFNGIQFIDKEGEVVYRENIVEHIRRLLPPNLLYDDSRVMGKARLCKEVGKMFEKAPWRRNGVKVVGLYGVSGSGKTTISISLCNFYSGKFNGKVFHVEFGRENFVKIQKQVLKVLTGAGEGLLNSVFTKEQGWQELRQRMPRQRVFLAVDNISDISCSIEDAQSYLSLGFPKGSLVLLTARSPVVLNRLLPEAESIFMPVPTTEEEEAIGILLKLTPVEPSNLTSEQKVMAIRCINKCKFGGKYHPLALQAFGADLYDRFGSDLLKWNEIPDFRDAGGGDLEQVYRIFEHSFEGLSPIHIKIFMLVALYLPFKGDDLVTIVGWLAIVCDIRIPYIQNVIRHLKKKGLIENDKNGIDIHDLLYEFAQKQANDKWKSWCFLREAEVVPICLKQTQRLGLEGVNFSKCLFQTLPISYNPDLFGNILVLHLEYMYELRKLDVSSLKVLKSLVVKDCKNLEEIYGIEGLPNLAWIGVVGRSQLTAFSPIGNLTALKRFNLDCPTTIQMGDICNCKSLQEIDMDCELLEEFPGLEGLPDLRKIKFFNCSRVTKPLDLSRCSKLTYVELEGCSLMSSPPNVQGCSQLENISFDSCSALVRGPDLSRHPSLRSVEFGRCSAMIYAPNLRESPLLEYATFTKCSAMTHGPDFSHCPKLDWIKFEDCSKMTHPPIVHGCSNLRDINFTRNKELNDFPDLDGLTALQNLYIDASSTRVQKAPEHLECCIGLRTLFFKGVENLPCFRGLTSLHTLRLEDCGINEAPDMRYNAELEEFILVNCPSVAEPPDLSECPKLKKVEIGNCGSLTRFPGLAGLSHLEWVRLTGCELVAEPPDLTHCEQLSTVEIEKCASLTRFPSFANLWNLKFVVLSECENVWEPPDVSNCGQLESVEIRECGRLTTFPSFAGLVHLKWALLRKCQVVCEPPDISGCVGLESFRLIDNPNMEKPPTMVDCTSLSIIKLNWRLNKAEEISAETPQITACPFLRHLTYCKDYSVGNQRFVELSR